LTTARAIAIHAGVFITLGGIQIAATALIMLCATRYKDTPCSVHLPRQPTATTTTGTGIPGNEPGSCCPAGRSTAASATAAEHGGHCAHPPVLHPQPDSVSARSGREPDVQAGRSRLKSRIAAAVPCANGARPGGSRPRTEFQGRT
jgi:hypothetical protein